MKHCRMDDDIEEVLLSAEKLQSVVKDLGARISSDYADKNLCVVGILKGSLIFMSDLIRAISVPCVVDFISVSSYGTGIEPGDVRIQRIAELPLADLDILVVEDIVDTGATLSRILDLLQACGPASLRLCALLDKPARRRFGVRCDYTGAQIPDRFVVGYGLDYAERYRNLPYVGVLKKQFYQQLRSEPI